MAISIVAAPATLRKIGAGWSISGSGGNSRGEAAIDLQTARSAASQVASGNHSVIGGGELNTASGARSAVGGGGNNAASGVDSCVHGGGSNTASGDHATIGGGYSNTASGYYTTVGGGVHNTASGYQSTVGGGTGNAASSKDSCVHGGSFNTASGDYATIGGGYCNSASGGSSTVGGGRFNRATGTDTTVAGGHSNTASGYYTTVGGGVHNTASGRYATVSGGARAVADKPGQNAHAAGGFGTSGDAQTSVLLARIATSSATPAELYLDGIAAPCTIKPDTTWAFAITVVARRTETNNESAAYQFLGCIDNNAGTTALVGSVAKTVVAEDSPAWDCNVTADDANDALIITATGEAGKTIQWVARIELVETTG